MSSIDELLAAAEADVTRGWLPACQVAVARDGKLAAFATFGAATDDTRFAVFSATKPIVAAAAWVLMGEGLLDVARPVADYVPEFATHGKHAAATRWTASPRRSTSDGASDPCVMQVTAAGALRCRTLASVPGRDVAMTDGSASGDDAASVVRTRARGVTVMPSAEGRSLRSDPRWTRDGARRTDRLLERLVTLRRDRAPAAG
jgi:hypothetical protein